MASNGRQVPEIGIKCSPCNQKDKDMEARKQGEKKVKCHTSLTFKHSYKISPFPLILLAFSS